MKRYAECIILHIHYITKQSICQVVLLNLSYLIIYFPYSSRIDRMIHTFILISKFISTNDKRNEILHKKKKRFFTLKADSFHNYLLIII